MRIYTKDPLVKKYLLKDDTIDNIKRPVIQRNPSVHIMKTPEHNDTLMICPACIGFQIKARMFRNKLEEWECSECHNTINPADLGLKPLQEDEIAAANDPYKPPSRLYTTRKKLSANTNKYERDQMKEKQPGHYKMFDKKKFESQVEAMTAKLD
jgi:hypothetical protein